MAKKQARKAQSRDAKVDEIIGAKIRQARKGGGLSQKALGLQLGISFQQIQKYENGINSVAAARIPALCKALGITLRELFKGTGAR